MTSTLTLNTGDTIPAIGFGTWQLDADSAYYAVKLAVEIGYRHLDCAHIYGNEAHIGRALDEIFPTIDRGRLWVTSKLWNDCHRPELVEPALKTTLANLRLDYLDLYLMHWPIAQRPGVVRPETGQDFESLEDVPLLETWQAMEACQRSGLCRNLGVANFNIPKLKNLLDHGSIAPAMNQVESHPFLQQNELLNFCQSNEIGFTAYSPLGSRARPERLLKENEPSLFGHPEIQRIADKHDNTPAQILLAWAVGRGTIPIPKSSNPDRMRENFAAVDIELDNDDMLAIGKINKDYRFIDGSFWALPGSPYTVEMLWDR
jgi:alcohol dehydrogenase (NADP+)